MLKSGFLWLLILGAIACSRVKIPVPELVESEYGPIEFHGLNDWTVERIQEYMLQIAPDEPLYACAQILKDDLNFPETSVLRFPDATGEFYSVVTLVEPGEDNRVQYHKESNYSENISLPEEWENLTDFRIENSMDFNTALQIYPVVLGAGIDSARKEIASFDGDPEFSEKVWNSLSGTAANIPADRLMQVIHSDSDRQKRWAAAILLMNFPDHDEAWNALMHAQIDPNYEVREMARTVLNLFRFNFVRKVDWSASQNSIRHILNGTHLFTLYVTLDLLAKTEIDPILGQTVLKNNYTLVLSYLAGSEERHKNVAHNFLTAVSNQDFHHDVTQWQSWLSELPDR